MPPDTYAGSMSNADQDRGGDEDVKYFDPHSIRRGPLSTDSAHYLRAVAGRLHMPLSPELKGFDHYHIYPNLMIGVNEGVNTCVQVYMPVSAERMVGFCWLLTGTPDPKLDRGIIWEAAIKNWRGFTVTNWVEDQIACERVQTGVRHAHRHAIVGWIEERITHFQSMLLKDMNNGSNEWRIKEAS
jgi:hypothetical protein